MAEFISPADTAAKWGISLRRVTVLCDQGRIPGVYRVGSNWVIPSDAAKPADARFKSEKLKKADKLKKAAPKDSKVNTSPDHSNLSAPFQALIGNQELFYQLLDLHPTPLQVFAPDGMCIFLNRAFIKLHNIPDANIFVGNYNYSNDPVCLEIMGQDVYNKVSHGEAVSVPDFPAPIQDVMNRGKLDEKPYEAATMDLFFLPLWDGGVFACTLCFYTVKRVYYGKADIVKAQEYIDNHSQGDFDLDEISQAANISRWYFARLFKEVTGDTPFEYYQKAKTKRIKEKLLDDSLSIGQAFEACGADYHKTTYLRLFKEMFKTTPSLFRKENNIKKP